MTRTAEPRTFTAARPTDLSQREAVVLDTLQRPAASYGLHVSSLAQATGYSDGTVRPALASLVERGLVKQSPYRQARGYTFVAVSDEERARTSEAEEAVEALEEALGALTGMATGYTVARLHGGGISLRLSRSTAQAVLATLKHAVED